MDARIIGPASELGEFHTLTVFGHVLSRDWLKIEPDAVTLIKLQGNGFVELRDGGKTAKAEAPADSDVKARLTELGVEFDGRSKRSVLETMLEEAEAAKAAAEAGEA